MNIINSYRFGAAAFSGFGNASRSFNGVNDYIDLGDSTDFTFGNGTTDSPLSVAMWIKMDDATRFRLIGKWDNSGGGTYEWLFDINAADKLGFFVYDQSIGNTSRKGRLYNTPMTSYEGTWTHIAATYNGDETDPMAGISVYVDGFAVDDTDSDGGASYTAMEDTAREVTIGVLAGTYSDGKICDIRLFDAELSADNISDLANGIDYQTNLVGWWLDDDDDVLDNAGTNDGTNNGSTYDTDGPAD